MIGLVPAETLVDYVGKDVVVDATDNFKSRYLIMLVKK